MSFEEIEVYYDNHLFCVEMRQDSDEFEYGSIFIIKNDMVLPILPGMTIYDMIGKPEFTDACEEAYHRIMAQRDRDNQE